MALVLKTTTNPGRAEWLPENAGGGGNYVVWRPAGPAATDVYLTFSEAHAAAVVKIAASGLPCIMYCQSDATMDTEAGAFDMSFIQLWGLHLESDPQVTPDVIVRAIDGTTFTNWFLGARDMQFIKLGAGTLCTVVVPALGIITAEFGPNLVAYTLAGGGAGNLFDLSGVGTSFVMRMLDGTTFAQGDGGTAFVVGPDMTFELQMRSRTEVQQELIVSDASSFVNYAYEGSSAVESPQTANLGTVTPADPGLAYVDGTAGAGWIGAAPTTVGEAIDRIVAALGPIA